MYPVLYTLLLHDVHKLVGPCRQHQQLQQIRRNQGVSMGPLPYPKIFGSNLAMEAKHFPLNNLLVSVLGTKPPQIFRPSPGPVQHWLQATVVQLPRPWLCQVHGLVTTATLLPVSDHYRRIFDLIFPILIDYVLIFTPFLVLLKGTLQ